MAQTKCRKYKKLLKVSFKKITQKNSVFREYHKVNEVLQGSILGSKYTTDVTNRGVHSGGREGVLSIFDEGGAQYDEGGVLIRGCYTPEGCKIKILSHDDRVKKRTPEGEMIFFERKEERDEEGERDRHKERNSDIKRERGYYCNSFVYCIMFRVKLLRKLGVFCSWENWVCFRAERLFFVPI